MLVSRQRPLSLSYSFEVVNILKETELVCCVVLGRGIHLFLIARRNNETIKKERALSNDFPEVFMPLIFQRLCF